MCKSRAMRRTIPGRCTLTATLLPSCNTPSYTCPILAAAIGSALNSLYKLYFGPGAGASHSRTAPNHPNSLLMISSATALENGPTWSCNTINESAASSPMISGLVLNVCASLMNTGPNFAMPSLNALPRFLFSRGIPIRSSYIHVAYTPPITDNTSAILPANSVGEFLKKSPTASILSVKP